MRSPNALTPQALVPPARAAVKAIPTPRLAPRLLRIVDAADYLSCTFGFMETVMREKTIPMVVLGKRHLFDVRDLDAYVEQMKEENATA
jgi:excisionase family DNA binding protein